MLQEAFDALMKVIDAKIKSHETGASEDESYYLFLADNFKRDWCK